MINRGVHPERVAKFGGSSMAAPGQVAYQLEQPGNEAGVVVVSAPGVDKRIRSAGVKVTDLLISYDKSPSHMAMLQIKSRFAGLTGYTDESGQIGLWDVVENIETDIARWRSNGDAIPALGEFWSAKAFAALTGRIFVDAREIINFDANNNLDEDKTNHAIKERLAPGKSYVVPGFYGSNPEGRVVTFPRGGSDITWAIIAAALGAEEAHNWSDVNGFMTAPPRHTDVKPTRLRHITYREAHAFASGGSELLHRDAARILGGTGIQAYVRNTFGYHGDKGTKITDSRSYGSQPIVGVTAPQPSQSAHSASMHIIGESLTVPSRFGSETIATVTNALDNQNVIIHDISIRPHTASLVFHINPRQVATAVRTTHNYLGLSISPPIEELARASA